MQGFAIAWGARSVAAWRTGCWRSGRCSRGTVERDDKGVLILLGAAVLAVAGFFGARYWQGMQDQFTRIAPPSGCDLRAGPLRAAGRWRIGDAGAPSQIPVDAAAAVVRRD